MAISTPTSVPVTVRFMGFSPMLGSPRMSEELILAIWN
jgi:hypothetical protein